MLSQKNGESPRRRYRRFTLEFPLEVCGVDEQGHPFRTTAWVRNASPEGGCLAIDKDIQEGTVLRLVSPKGLQFEAIVCWGSYSYKTDSRLIGFVLTSGQEQWVLAGHRPTPLCKKRKHYKQFNQTLLKKIANGIGDLVAE